MGNAEVLVKRLASFRTRSEAMDALTWMGEAAVEPLMQALRSRHESVRWAAVKCLGDIGDERAVPCLIELQDAESERSHAMESLQCITGESFKTVDEWRQWWNRRSGESEPAAEGPAKPGQAVSDGDLVREAVKGLKVEISARKGRFDLDVSLPEGRHQRMMLLMSAKDPDGHGLVVIYSECAPAKPDRFEWALRRNLTMPYGSLAIRDGKSGPKFVMFNTLLRGSLTPLELRKSILTVARKADQVEKALTDEDAR